MVGDKRIASKLSVCSVGTSSVVDVSDLEGVSDLGGVSHMEGAERNDIRGTRYAGEAI